MEILNILDKSLVERMIRISLTILVGFFLSKILSRSITISLGKIIKRTPPANKSRLVTLSSILTSVINFLLIGIIILIVASELGFDIAPILTGAGIAGLAISFGSQTLVKDLISGFFLILDNQVNIGDKVKIGDQEGIIMQIQMRNIVLRDKDKNLIYIPNSEIKRIIVFRQDNHKLKT